MNSVREKFIQYIDSFVKDINSLEPMSPNHVLAGTLKINREWMDFLLPSIPEFIFSAIGTKKSEHKNLIELWGLDSGDHPNTLDGVVSCHALSPMGDTIDLLADLGRSARISAILDKELHIMLADIDWTSLNWTVRDYGEHNLIKIKKWRQPIYKSIGAKVNLSSLDNSGHVKKEEIESLASSYADLSRALFGKENIGKRIDNKKVKKLIGELAFSTNTEPSINLLKNDIIDKNIGREFAIIKDLMKNLKRVDERTFTYYFTQRYHQYRYNNYLKLAVRSERNFDVPFFGIDSWENKDKLGIVRAIYFEYYMLGLNEDACKQEFVIPYYFPSGSLYQDSSKLEEYKSKVIMLDDYDYKDKNKFIRVFGRMGYPHNARLASDYLSFIHMYLSHNKSKRKFRSDVQKILEKYSSELADSWNTYTKSDDFSKSVMTWRDYVFSAWPSGLKLPYYFYPYILLLDEGFRKEFEMMLFELFNLTMKNIQPALDCYVT